MILIYTKDGDLNEQALELTRPISDEVGYRAARYWRGEIEKVSLVYSDNEKIREAYLRRGIEAKPITAATQKPQPKPATVQAAAPKPAAKPKATRKPRTKKP